MPRFLILPHPLLCHDTQVEEVGDVVLLEVTGGMLTKPRIGLPLTYVPYVDEIPALEGGLLLELGGRKTVGVVAAGGSILL